MHRRGNLPRVDEPRAQPSLYPIPEFEAFLKMWEDYWTLQHWIEQVELEGQRRKPTFRARGYWSHDRAFTNHRRFREYLSAIHQRDPSLSEIEDFRCASPLLPEVESDLRSSITLMTFPEELAAWSMASRRLYDVTPELQAVLGATDLGQTCWSDLRLPHASFALRLAKPLKLLAGFESSLLMLSTVPNDDGGVMIVHAFPTIAPRYLSIRRDCERELRQLLASVDFLKACSLIQENLDRITGHCAGSVFFSPNVTHRGRIETFIESSALEFGQNIIAPVKMDEAELAQLDTAPIFRILLGFAMYLKTLPAVTPHVSNWVRPENPGAIDPHAVTLGTQVCSVRSCYNFSPEMRNALGLGPPGASGPRSWEFVRGYWRRLAGLGSDCLAPKTQHVLPYMRRIDRMPPENGLPGGASHGLQG